MRDPKTEHYLDRGQYKWKYQEKIALADIDIERSEANPSRLLRRLDEDRAIAYGVAMEAGDQFPAIVLLQLDPATPGKKYLIATGVHRVKGAETCDRKTFDAYVIIEPDAYREEVLIRQLNTLEGQGVTISDRIAQVLLLHEKYPDKSLTVLCREWYLKEKAVKYAWSAGQAIKRGQRLGYDMNKAKIAKTIQVALNGIHSDVVFKRAVQLALTPSVSTGEIDEMVKEIKKGPREESAGIAIVERHIHEATQRRIQAQAKHGRISPAPAHKLLGNCKRVLRQIEEGIEHLHLSAIGDPDRALVICEETMKYLKQVITELERVRRQRDASASFTPTGLSLH